PQLYDYALNEIEPRLESIPGVASASLNGGRQRQINIVVDPVKAQARGLTSSDVAAAVGNANALLPSGELIQPTFDAIVYTKAILQALILVALVILVFLQSFRGTLVVSLAIPLSFAITLIVLYATGQTLNVFTLGGLTLAMGRLVDNAVVVLESIHRYRQKGL